MEGSYEMYRVPNKLLLATDRDIWLLAMLEEKEPELYKRYSMENYFESLHFGDVSHH